MPKSSTGNDCWVADDARWVLGTRTEPVKVEVSNKFDGGGLVGGCGAAGLVERSDISWPFATDFDEARGFENVVTSAAGMGDWRRLCDFGNPDKFLIDFKLMSVKLTDLNKEIHKEIAAGSANNHCIPALVIQAGANLVTPILWIMVKMRNSSTYHNEELHCKTRLYNPFRHFLQLGFIRLGSLKAFRVKNNLLFGFGIYQYHMLDFSSSVSDDRNSTHRYKNMVLSKTGSMPGLTFCCYAADKQRSQPLLPEAAREETRPLQRLLQSWSWMLAGLQRARKGHDVINDV